MAVIHNWHISQLERALPSGGVILAHWRLTSSDGEYSASAYGTVSFTPDPTAPNFVPFDQLTEADVLVWVWDKLGRVETEARLEHQIGLEKNPTTAEGLPWA